MWFVRGSKMLVAISGIETDFKPQADQTKTCSVNAKFFGGCLINPCAFSIFLIWIQKRCRYGKFTFGAQHAQQTTGKGNVSLSKMQEQTARRVFLFGVCLRRVKNRLALIKCTAMGAVEEKGEHAHAIRTPCRVRVRQKLKCKNIGDKLPARGHFGAHFSFLPIAYVFRLAIVLSPLLLEGERDYKPQSHSTSQSPFLDKADWIECELSVNAIK